MKKRDIETICGCLNHTKVRTWCVTITNLAKGSYIERYADAINKDQAIELARNTVDYDFSDATKYNVMVENVS